MSIAILSRITQKKAIYVCGSICMQYRQSEYSNLFHISNSLYLSHSAAVIVLCEQNNLQAVLQTCTADAIMPSSMLDACCLLIYLDDAAAAND
jgi:fructose-1-phosphate kinase PfkB-like protein